MEEIKYEATFSSSVPCRWLFVIRGIMRGLEVLRLRKMEQVKGCV